MLNANDLRLEIARQRVDYGWTIYANHGLVRGDPPILVRDGAAPLEKLAGSLFPKSRPEGFDISEEIRRDLDSLDVVLAGRYDPGTNSKKLAARSPIIRIEEGELNCAHLAYNGILTPNAYRAMRRRKRTDLAGHYSLKALAEVFGISVEVVYGNFDQEQALLFGAYPTTVNDRREKGGLDEAAIQMLARSADDVVLLAEVAEHLYGKYGTTDRLASHKVYRFGKFPSEYVSEGDPYRDYNFSVFDLFKTYKVIDLGSLNGFANVLIRDKRILETHFGTVEAASRLGMLRRSARGLIERGSLSARQTSILPSKGTRKKPYLICEHDISRYAERRSRLSRPQIEERLARGGVSNCKDRFFAYLKEKGWAEGNLQGSQGIIAPDKIDELIASMRADGRFSSDYMLYCQVKEVDPHDESSLAQFQRDYCSFKDSKEIVAFITDNFDFTYFGKPLGELDAREVDAGIVKQHLLQKNQTPANRLTQRFGQIGSCRIITDTGSVFVPASASYSARQIAGSARYSKNHRLRKRLLEQGFIRRMLGFYEFIELSDLLEVNARLAAYHDVLSQTVGAQDLAGLTGFDKNSVYFCASLGLIPGIKVGKPYSDRPVYRFTQEQVKAIDEKNRSISFRDIHSIALHERILMTEERLRGYFHEFRAMNPPQRDGGVMVNNGAYNHVYAQAFISYTKRKLGQRFEEREQAALILPFDRIRSERLNPDLLMAKKSEEMSFGEAHNLALYCKTHNGDELASRVFRHFQDRFFSLAIGKTMASADEVRSYAPQAVWEAVRSYDLYSGQHFLQHFDSFIRSKFIPEVRGEFSGFGQVSLNQSIGDDDRTTLENLIADDSPSPAMLAEIKEGKERIASALARLEEQQQEVIKMYYFDELDEADISKGLGLRPKEVSAILTRSIDALRKILSYRNA